MKIRMGNERYLYVKSLGYIGYWRAEQNYKNFGALWLIKLLNSCSSKTNISKIFKKFDWKKFLIKFMQGTLWQYKTSFLFKLWNLNIFFVGRFLYNDPETNPGVIISPMISNLYRSDTSIKLVVYPTKGERNLENPPKPISFTCDG